MTGSGRAATGAEPDACRLEARPCGWLRGPAGEDLWVYSASWTLEKYDEGEDLRGIRVGFHRFRESHEALGPVQRGGVWLSSLQGAVVESHGVGLEMGFLISPAGPLRVGARGIFGLRLRRNDPGRSLGMVEGIGMDLGVWIGRRVQLAATFDLEHDGISGLVNTRTGLSLRVGAARSSSNPRGPGGY